MLPILESSFRWLLHVSWQASILALLVMGLQWSLGKRLSARWRYALWLVVIARLIVPLGPNSAWSVYNFFRLESIEAFSSAEDLRPGANPDPETRARAGNTLISELVVAKSDGMISTKSLSGSARSLGLWARVCLPCGY